MEKVFLVSGDNKPQGVLAGQDYLKNGLVPGSAIVEKVLGPRQYLVSLTNGTKLTAFGPEALSKGSKVQVDVFSEQKLSNTSEQEAIFSPLKGERWSARMPLLLGGKAQEARLELYVEKVKQGFLAKKDPVVYLIFSVKTDVYGQIQWSVYLKRNQVLVQVYAEKGSIGKKDIRQMILEFEDSLKKKGFSLMAPTVILKRPFKAPAGFQLNVRG
jgi:hypothetical protein